MTGSEYRPKYAVIRRYKVDIDVDVLQRAIARELVAYVPDDPAAPAAPSPGARLWKVWG